MITAKESKPLKIAIFVSYTYPFVGSGIGNVALKQAESLVQSGHEVTLISSNVPLVKKEFSKNGVRFIKINAFNFLYKLAIPVPLFLFNKKTIDVIKNADIVHVHDILYPSSILATAFAKIYKKPVILTQHIPFIEYDTALFNLLQRLVFHTMGKFVINNSEKIVYFNSEVGKWLHKYKEKLVYLPNGVDTEFFYPISKKAKKNLRERYSVPANLPVVLFVGRMVPKKGYDLVMKSADIKYFTLMVGGGEGSRTKSYVKHENLLLLGQKSPEQLREIYQLSDIFLLPSHSEGYPLSVQEAMASGLAVIVSDLQCYRDFKLSRKFVTFIKPSVPAIQKAITNIISNPAHMQEMKKYSQDTALRTHQWEKNINQIVKLYEDVVR